MRGPRRRRRPVVTVVATLSFVLAAAAAAARAQIYIPQVPLYPSGGGGSKVGGIHLGHNDNADDDDELEPQPAQARPPSSPQAAGPTWRDLDALEGELSGAGDELALNNRSLNGKSTLGSLLVAGAGLRKSHTIRWPNGQIIQTCDDPSGARCDDPSGARCDDQNAVCQVGGCVCKQGFYLNRQGAACQSIEDLLKNCENDLQCQAYNVDLICDNKSAETSFCVCPEGLLLDQDTITCLPCAAYLRSMTAEPERSSNSSSASSAASSSAAPAPGATSANATRINRCKQHLDELVRLSGGKGPQQPADQSGGSQLARPRKLGRLDKGLPGPRLLMEKLYGGPNSTLDAMTTPIMHPSSASSSDPFKIRTPLEVFMGAIILFTVLIVIWFFLRRMFHDCRAIFRSLRHSGAGELGAAAIVSTLPLGPEHHYGARSAVHHHHFFDPNRQAAVTRLLATTDPSANPFASHLYQRELAGVMVQHLAANLSPSSTSYALVGLNGTTRTATSTGGALSPTSLDVHEAALYQPLSSQQQRAAAAAAQLLLSPSHPALAILRAAAAAAVAQTPNSPDYQVQANLLSSMFDPPPKYEEAIAAARDNQQQQQSSSSTTPPPPPIDANESQPMAAQEFATVDGGSPNSTTRSSLANLGEGQLRIYVSPGEHLPYSDDLVATASPEENTAQQQSEATAPPDQTAATTRQQSSRRFPRRFRRSRG